MLDTITKKIRASALLKKWPFLRNGRNGKNGKNGVVATDHPLVIEPRSGWQLIDWRELWRYRDDGRRRFLRMWRRGLAIDGYQMSVA